MVEPAQPPINIIMKRTIKPKLPQRLKFVLLYPVPVKIEIILNDDCLIDVPKVWFDITINHNVIAITRIKSILKNNFIWSSLKKDLKFP